MRNKREGLRLFLALALMYGAVFSLRHWFVGRVRAVVLETSRSEYFHDEFVEFRLRTRDSALNASWRARPPVVTVTRAGKAVPTIGGILQVALQPEFEGWVGRWPCPWNAAAGQYSLELSSSEPFASRLESRPFWIAYRVPLPLPKGFAVLTWESDLPLATLRVAAPDGTTKDWRGLLDWVQYVGADAFWMLGGRTPGDRRGEVWASHNMVLFPEVAAECRKRGIKFGLYAMCYLTMSSTDKVPGYEYAKDVKDGKVYETRAISLRDKARARHVAELLKGFRDIPGVDFVGLDYIRNALGGVELVEDFFNEMPGLLRPAAWASWTIEERMVWFARKKSMRRDSDFIDAWQWWRAQRAAHIVRAVKAEVGSKTPLWAFTLTWDKGWHHGQDPVMMNDAGVDADALMLYEADAEQFSALLHDWSRYVKRSDVQLVVGDIIDWPLHQRHPDGPREFYRRSVRAIDGIYADGPARGVFFHDLARALYGNKGHWSTRQWLDQARAAVEHLRVQEKP